MRRRDFIGLLGGAASASVSRPLVARAQQRALPVIGFLHPVSAEAATNELAACRQGLKEAGYIEGENVTFEHRSANNQLERLPGLAADLVRRRVAVIVTGTAPGILAAKAATTTIPIVFNIGEDPVRRGLVNSLARPGANVTGVNFLVLEVGAKRLGLLHQLVPGAVRVALLVSPANAAITESTLQEMEPAARAMGLQMQVFKADTSDEIDAVFATLGRERHDALFVGTGPFFTSRRVQLSHWATRIGIPATFGNRQYAEAGGLMSYGASLTDAYRQVGRYIGRILKGTKPADLPVMQSTKFELVINLQAAKMLRIEVPPGLLAIADEVIE
jgi:putative tryptophan/tyrosine transport system substrate-binding protein